MDTYTQPGGGTPQGQATNSLQTALNTIQGMAPGSPAGQAQAQASQVSSQEPQMVQQAQQNLTQQAGIPQLQGQQADMGKIFQMYLADQHLSQKYTIPQLGSPNSPVFNNPSLTPQQGVYTGEQSQVPNPYLASPQALINAVTQPSGQGFQGVTNPSQNTSVMGAVPNAASSISNLLSSAIGQEQSLVNQQTGNYTTAYESKANLLNTIAGILGNQLQLNQPGGSASLQTSLNNVKSDVAKGMTFTDLLQRYETDPNMTAAKLQEMYDAKHAVPGDKWGPAQITPQLAAAYNLKQTPASAGTKYQLKTIGTTQYNYDPKSGKLYDMSGKQLNADAFSGHNDLQNVFSKLKQAWEDAKTAPTPANRQKYMTEKQLMADKLYYALTKSRAYQGAQQLVGKLPDPWNPLDTLGGQGEAAFSGFEDQLSLGGQQAIENTGGGNKINRQNIVSGLKKAGYNDNAIHEYLKMKGVDK